MTTIVFTVTLFLSATLLFFVQPMIGKTILPAYGGTPAVWITCMLFFQAILLAGYSYAHGVVRGLGVRRQALTHLAVLLLPFLALPLQLVPEGAPTTRAGPVWWLLLHLLVSAGLPLFVVSSTAPLLQRWFAQTGSAGAGDPYFLYAASNAGSLLGLLGYPLLIERHATLDQQARLWTAGYVVLVLAIAGCALFVWSSIPRSRIDSSFDGDGDESVRPGHRVRWVLLALVPSSFLLGVTNHITTNIAAVPMLWVVPLALYLTTFILAFARKVRLPHRWVLGAFPYLVLALGPLTLFDSPDLSWAAIPPHLLLFFGVAMMCHGELSRTRPAPHHLTEFYLWIAVGGVLGGVTNALAAPLLFDSIVEYPLMLVAGCLLFPARPANASSLRERALDLVYPLLLAATLAAIAVGVAIEWLTGPRLWIGVMIAVGAATCYLFKDRPVRFGAGVAVLLLAVAQLIGPPADRLLLAERNFFGVKRVVDDEDGRFRRFVHGTTNHGMQWLDPQRRDEPTAYYHRSGPMGDIFNALAEMGSPREAAILGLGAGGLACYALPGQRFTFYEIDPDVIRIARDPAFFTFLSDCSGTYDVVPGDGRLELAAAPDAWFDLIVLDAFSSDAVPTHLLTREALEIYLQKLGEGGMLVFNITNAYLRFETLMGNLAREQGLTGRHRKNDSISPSDRRDGKMASHYVVMARREEELGSLATDPAWHPLEADPETPVWTDRFCDILSLLRRPRRPTGVESWSDM